MKIICLREWLVIICGDFRLVNQILTKTYEAFYPA